MVYFAVQMLFSLIQYCLFIFAFVSLAFGLSSTKHYLRPMSVSLLPLFSIRNFMISGLTFNSNAFGVTVCICIHIHMYTYIIHMYMYTYMYNICICICIHICIHICIMQCSSVILLHVALQFSQAPDLEDCSFSSVCSLFLCCRLIFHICMAQFWSHSSVYLALCPDHTVLITLQYINDP